MWNGSTPLSYDSGVIALASALASTTDTRHCPVFLTEPYDTGVEPFHTVVIRPRRLSFGYPPVRLETRH